MILRSRRKTLVSAFLLAVLLAMTYWAVVSASPASPQGEVPKDPVGTVLGTQEWFVKFDGIDGESRIDDGHEAWCDILSFSQAIHRPGTGTGATRRRGDVVLEDIVVSKEIDKCDPKLAESTLTGRIFPKVEIHLTALPISQIAYSPQHVTLLEIAQREPIAVGLAVTSKVKKNHIKLPRSN